MEIELTAKAKKIKKLYDRDFFSKTDLKNMMTDLVAAENAEKPKIKKAIKERLNTLGFSVDSKDNNENDDIELEQIRKKVTLAISSYAWAGSIRSEIIHTLYHTFQQYAAPADFLLRLVEAHEPRKEDTQKSIFHGQRLRLRLLKMAAIMLLDMPAGSMFLDNYTGYNGLGYIKKYCINKYCDKKTCTKQKLKALIVEKLDDSIFNILENPKTTSEQTRRNGTYGLLRVCDNLEDGYFDNKTRMDLFFFAVAYQFSAEECIEKLFEEYYINNLLACISDERNNSVLPDGHGIHWKDYRDIVWLYYTDWQYKDTDNRSPIETLAKIEMALAQLKGDTTYHSQHKTSANTAYYADLRYDVLFNIKENQFLDFMRETYDCSGTVQQTASAIQNEEFMQTQLTMDSGFTFFSSDTIKDACSIPRDNFQEGTKSEAFNSFFNEVAKILKESECCDPEEEHIKRFCRMFYHAIRYMTTSENTTKRKNAVITRTEVLAHYHAYYNQKNKGKHKNFSEVWADYTHRITGLDQYLNDANFIPMSEKNIIDMMCVLSSYYSMQSDADGAK